MPRFSRSSGLSDLMVLVIIGTLVLVTMLRPASQVVLAQDPPSFGPISISLDYTANGFKPIEAADIFPSGIDALVATVCTANMPAGKLISIQWFLDGLPEAQPSEATTAGNDCLATPLFNEGGLKPGTWEIRYQMDGNLVASRSFALTPTPGIYDLKFGQDVAVISRQIIGERREFPSNTTFVAVVYRFVNMPEGATVTGQWLRDGQVDHEFPISIPPGRGISYFALQNDSGIPAGLWELRISVNGQPVKTGNIIVG